MENNETETPENVYTCECEGCWACSGHVTDCTCDVDWDKVYGHED